MNKHQILHLEQLVQDCEAFRLNEKEAMEYIKKRFGKEVSIRHYYRIKKKISSEEYVQFWLNEQGRIGFAIEFKKRIDEMQVVHKTLLDILKKEMPKVETEQKQKGILKLFDMLLKTNERLLELSKGTPIIQSIKNRLDLSEKIISENS